AVLQDAPDRSLRPADALPPQRGEYIDWLFPDLRVDRPRDPDAVRRGQPAGEIEVLGQRLGPPSTDPDQQLSPNDDSVAAELRASAERPSPALDLTVGELLIRLRTGQARRPRLEHPAANGHRPGTGTD